MSMKEITTDSPKILNEIINQASELPLEDQELLLSVAKGMAYTKSCTQQQSEKRVR